MLSTPDILRIAYTSLGAGMAVGLILAMAVSHARHVRQTLLAAQREPRLWKLSK